MNIICKPLRSIFITYLIAICYLLYTDKAYSLGTITDQDNQSTIDSNYNENLQDSIDQNAAQITDIEKNIESMQTILENQQAPSIVGDAKQIKNVNSIGGVDNLHTELETIYTIVGDNANAIAGIDAETVTNNKNNIATNKTATDNAIAANAAAITTNTNSIATNTTDIATNKTATETNAAAIATNTAAIATNTTDIATNKTATETNAAAITTNAAAIATNTTDIATNKTATETNAAAITTNAAAIATNATDISELNISDINNTDIGLLSEASNPTSPEFIVNLEDIIKDLRAEIYSIKQNIGNTSGVAAGVIMAWAGELAQKPAGWAYADGTALDCATYSDLCTALNGISGYTWGDSAGNFNLPDLRGYVLRGLDNTGDVEPNCTADRNVGSSVNSNTIGGRDGCVVGSYQSDATAAPKNPDATIEILEGNDSGDGATSTVDSGNQSAETKNTKIVEFVNFDNETRMKNAAVHYIISCGNKSDQKCAAGNN